MTHVKEQNWFAVGLDVLVVIFGVYIGIYIGELAEDRQYIEDRDIALQALEDELRSDLTRLDEIIKFQEGKVKKIDEGLKSLISGTLSNSEINDLIEVGFGANYTYFPGRSAYQAMKNSGYLASHPDRELRLQVGRLFERHYVRQDTNAESYDQLTYDANIININPVWNMVTKQPLNEQRDYLGVIANALDTINGQGVYYVDLLKETVRVELVKTLEMIDAAQSTDE